MYFNGKRIVVTGMSINTPLGDTVEGTAQKMLKGESAISRWKSINSESILSKIGGDLSSYELDEKLKSYEHKIPEEIYRKAQTVFKQVTDATKHAILLTLSAYESGNFLSNKLNPYDIGVICAGHNLPIKYLLGEYEVFKEDPEFIEGLCGLKVFDTDTSSSVSEVFNIKGGAFSMGGVCATANIGLHSAVHSILADNKKAMIVVSPPLLLSTFLVQSFVSVEAICYKDFQDAPEKASRPYDKRRCGFLPCEGGGALILEELEHAKKRGAPIYAELLGVNISSDGNHLGNPSQEGQAMMMKGLLEKTAIRPEQVDFISAHATSTPLGDVTEINAIKEVFKNHAYSLFINAPKSLLGHTLWGAGIVEGILGIWQMNHGIFHQSHNIDTLDERVDLDVCSHKNVEREISIFLNNSFGMGGINSGSLFRKYSNV